MARLLVLSTTRSSGSSTIAPALAGHDVGLVSEAGMPAANIEVRGLGMSKPVADNKTRAGRSENRRVAIIVPAE